MRNMSQPSQADHGPLSTPRFYAFFDNIKDASPMEIGTPHLQATHPARAARGLGPEPVEVTVG